MNSPTEQKSVAPALTKGFAILDLIAREPGLGFAAIRDRLGLPNSSCHHLITTLCQLGALVQRADRGYVLGLRLFELGAMAANQRQLHDLALPTLRKLAQDIQLTCHLGVMEGAEAVYLLKVEGNREIRVNTWVGKRLSLHSSSLGKVLHESLTDGAQLLLLGAMAVGMISGEAGKAALEPFSGDLFKGMLAFFLLDMGLMTARNLPQLRGQSPWLMAYAVLGPLTHATLALALAWAFKVPMGDAILLVVLAASASYIAVPAVVRYAIPEANPTLYFSLSLGITFPLNILLGIPLYTEVTRWVWA